MFTSQRGLALDLFYLQDASGAPFGEHDARELDWVRREIEAVARQGWGKRPREPDGTWRPPAHELQPTVVVDNDATDAATIVEVSGRDRQGLLVALARALVRRRPVGPVRPHRETTATAAVDAFYVLTLDGEKLTEFRSDRTPEEPLAMACSRRPLSGRPRLDPSP